MRHTGDREIHLLRRDQCLERHTEGGMGLSRLCSVGEENDQDIKEKMTLEVDLQTQQFEI